MGFDSAYDFARRSSISLSLAVVSTGFAAPNIFVDEVGAAAVGGAAAAGCCCSSFTTIGSIGFVRGCSFSFGLVLGSAIIINNFWLENFDILYV